MSITRAIGISLIIALCAACACAQGEGQRLNNFVVELADVDLRAADAPDAVSGAIEQPGWLFISLSGEGPASATLSAGGEETVVLEAPGETMRYVEAGEIELWVTRGEGAELERLILRRVPEIMVYMYEGQNQGSPQGFLTHSWEDLDRWILHSANLIVSPASDAYIPYAQAWHERGGRWLVNQSMSQFRDETFDAAAYWAGVLGGTVWDGTIHDEVLSQDRPHFGRYAEGLARFMEMPESEGKTVYLFCGGSAAIGDPTLLDFFTPTEEAAFDGERSIRCAPAESADASARQMDVALEPGVEYTISAYMKTEDCVPETYSGVFVIDEGWHALYGRLAAPEGTSDWTRYEASFTPRESSNGLYQVVVIGPAQGGMWMDAVQIERGAEATEFAAGEPNVLENPSFEDGLVRWMRGSDDENPLRDAVVEYKQAFAPEIYLHEQATEERAQAMIDSRLVRLPESWSRHYPGVGPRSLIVLSIGDCTLRYSNDQSPSVNWKVLMDMQMHAMAASENGSTDLRGVGFWSAHYGSPEAIRWYGALFRHYCIEGSRERLTDDPYMLDHVANAGFEEGLEGWETSGAVETVPVAQMLDSGRRGRYSAVPEGANVLRTVRAEGGAANSFAQAVRNLEPGRLYSAKVYCTDPRYSDRLIPAEITIEGGEALPEYAWDNVWVSADNETRWTMHQRVFRATADGGRLTVGDVEPGEVYWDFVQVEPFFGEIPGSA